MKLVLVEMERSVDEVFDPTMPTSVRKSPGNRIIHTFLVHDGDDIPEGYEVKTLEYLRRVGGPPESRRRPKS